MVYLTKVTERSNEGFYLKAAGHMTRCTYQPTYGIERRNGKPKRVTYPAGAIRVSVTTDDGPISQDVESLSSARLWFSQQVEIMAENSRPDYIQIHGHSGLVGINTKQRLYVMPCGDGVSCYGFDVLERKATRGAEWLGNHWPKGLDGLEPGSIGFFDAWREISSAIKAKYESTGEKCPIELTPELIPYEGKRVVVTYPDGESKEFTVGKSSGWTPCHLEIESDSDDGGGAVYFPAGSKVRLA